MQNSKFRIILNVPPPPFLSHKKKRPQPFAKAALIVLYPTCCDYSHSI